MKKLIAFTVADKANEKYLDMFVKSLRHFHSEEELPLTIVNQDWLNKIKDPDKFYRMTPMIAKDLLKEYETVIKFDCDQIVTGKLNHLWESEYDLGVVLNSNPMEPPVGVWDIPPQIYLNCGLVAMRSKEAVDHWAGLCNSSHFQNYQMREQDLLNILVYYGNYKVLNFDRSDNWNGLISKGWWQYIEKRGDDLVLSKGDRPWPIEGDKIIKIIHWAGGKNAPDKMNYRIRFNKEVSDYLDFLTK
jgi:lipopolysaccharide biosynthesis glycosyltransferase